MGQQQLLLLVLGVVIVGLAVVVGIQAFSENQTSANADALVNDGVRIASDIQAWSLKPAAFGGGGGWVADADVDDPSWSDLGYQSDGDVYSNVNGDFALSATDCDTGLGDIVIEGTNDDTGNVVCIGVNGTDHNDIETEVHIGGVTSSTTTG